MTKKLKFICPECGHTAFEEIVINATVWYEIEIDEDGDYGVLSTPEYEDGDTEMVSCVKCNFKLGDSIEDAYEWLMEQEYNKSPFPVVFKTPISHWLNNKTGQDTLEEMLKESAWEYLQRLINPVHYNRYDLSGRERNSVSITNDGVSFIVTIYEDGSNE